MKKELKVLGLSYSQSSIGSYVIVLSDKNGNTKLPIIIKPNEAQRIAVEIENIKPSRPTIYDIFKNTNDTYHIDVQEIFIHKLLEGVFYTKILTSNGLENISIESTAGEAIALAVIYKCPIYVESDILENVGVVISDDGKIENDFYDESNEKKTKEKSVEELESLLNKAIENEEYEIAAEIRDKIQEKIKTK